MSYELFMKYINTKDIKYRDELIMSYLPLADNLAKLLSTKYIKIEYDDLKSYCYEALIKAIETFDITKCDKRYIDNVLIKRIKNILKTIIEAENGILSIGDYRKRNKIMKLQTIGFTNDRIKTLLNLSSYDFSLLINAYESNYYDIDKSYGLDSGYDVEQEFMKREFLNILDEFINRQNEKDREIAMMLVSTDYSYSKIARETKSSRRKVKEIYMNLIDFLKKSDLCLYI